MFCVFTVGSPFCEKQLVLPARGLVPRKERRRVREREREPLRCERVWYPGSRSTGTSVCLPADEQTLVPPRPRAKQKNICVILLITYYPLPITYISYPRNAVAPTTISNSPSNAVSTPLILNSVGRAVNQSIAWRNFHG